MLEFDGSAPGHQPLPRPLKSLPKMNEILPPDLDGGGGGNVGHSARPLAGRLSIALSIATVLASVGSVAAVYALREADGARLPPVAAGPGIHVVDGDTVDHDGQRWRLTGYDTPEIYHARCPQERQAGIVAAARLAALIGEGGARIDALRLPEGTDGVNRQRQQDLRSPEGTDGVNRQRKDKWGRRLGRLVLADGRDAGAELIAGGYARPYNGRTARHGWCE